MRPASVAHGSENDVGSLARSMRFVIGVAMVAAGVTLAVPAGQLVSASWSASRPGTPVVSAAIGPMPPLPQAPVAAAPAGQWMVPEESLPPPVTPRADYAPPIPPHRLPPVAAPVAAETPGINSTYRSTLQVPPPPLLDAQAVPPPAAAAWAAPSAAMQGPAAVASSPGMPSTYAIRDGDDLASIAARFYGHPGAAPSLWEANRDLIPNADLLPIGTEIRLPPPWTMHGVATTQQGVGRSIEPPPVAITPRSVDAAPVSAPWIDGGSTGPGPTIGPARAATVRLAPGETLETLAERFYGDRRAAARIWEANRDRLRSPELAVAGMELRLP